MPRHFAPTPPAGDKRTSSRANLEAERFGGLDNSTSRRGEFLRDEMKCSLYALCEVPEASRNAIRAVLGMERYKVFPVGFVCVLWDSTKWQHAGKESVDFGTAIHGAVRVTVEDLQGSGLRIDVISMHVRPTAITDQAGKQADIRKAMRALRRPGVPTIVAGDFNTKTAFDIIEPFGFVRSTPKINTLNDPGAQPLDAVFFTPDVQFRDSDQLDPGDISDHKVWLVKGTLVEA